MIRTNSKYKKGISLLIAVLISSVALLFSFAIVNIAVKEVILSQAGKDSQISFYASNSGIECALYWDLKFNAFNPDGPEGQITCINQDETVNMSNKCTGSSPNRVCNSGPIDFFLNPDDLNDPCFTIIISKEEQEEDNGLAFFETTIESRGYNTCTDGPRRLERALRAIY